MAPYKMPERCSPGSVLACVEDVGASRMGATPCERDTAGGVTLSAAAVVEKASKMGGACAAPDPPLGSVILLASGRSVLAPNTLSNVDKRTANRKRIPRTRSPDDETETTLNHATRAREMPQAIRGF